MKWLPTNLNSLEFVLPYVNSGVKSMKWLGEGLK